ncbi:transposase, IS4 family [Burkholderia thailandensis MSMB121]|nr:transposase, IS4 family [Burkholderia thailandensis MSMB121]
MEHSYWEQVEHDKAHGRLETRICRVGEDVDWLCRHWAGIKRLVMVESTPHIGEKLTTEQRYYISSKPAKAAEMMQLIRAHWGIENQLHWVLDVSWAEDACLIRDKIAARNMATLRKAGSTTAAQEGQPQKHPQPRRLRSRSAKFHSRPSMTRAFMRKSWRMLRASA